MIASALIDAGRSRLTLASFPCSPRTHHLFGSLYFEQQIGRSTEAPIVSSFTSLPFSTRVSTRIWDVKSPSPQVSLSLSVPTMHLSEATRISQEWTTVLCFNLLCSPNLDFLLFPSLWRVLLSVSFWVRAAASLFHIYIYISSVVGMDDVTARCFAFYYCWYRSSSDTSDFTLL